MGGAGGREGPKSGWWAAVRRTPLTAWNQDVTDWAAALTYYAVLALFPVLLVVLSVIGLSIPAATPAVIDHLTDIVPAESRGLLRDALRHTDGGSAWLLIAFGGVSGMWSGSSYLAVFRRALHAMHQESAHRPVWKTAPLILLTTVTIIVMLLVSSIALLVSGDLAHRLGDAVGVGGAALAAWGVLRWVVLLAVAVVLILLLYRSGPEHARGVRRMAPGGALAVLLLMAVSFGFTEYAAHVSTYHRVYGSLAGLVVFLIWLWLSNLALLLGALFNVELARSPATRVLPSPARWFRRGSPRPPRRGELTD
ncbi:YihY/virulence factor BrkB family protein [Streptomyces sp. SL13]|uniref:YihY/virulence factor BrkB family protein n=1 Tax=Streptantibioticus silvisoli TaxID=2705255 RepID=A0AA90KBW5_9ACTN|nr:YihY/virulence factor BrkB family protein [Streptantibioticus silvisoli]MDI5962010.1 YihY/virulence factor BrkB family protein [Streptantibioticus silvisoli]MDI5973857.1 YihY/virulence factor BrkB family protein [Streptantibioticus silvisoli]